MSLSRLPDAASATNAASAAAGFSGAGSEHAVSMASARSSRTSTSSPVSAAGTRPKTDSAENRPPTVGGEDTSRAEAVRCRERLERGAGVGDRDEAASGLLAAERLVGDLSEDGVERVGLDGAARLARHDVERRRRDRARPAQRRSCGAPWCRARAAWRRPTRRAPTRAPARRATSRPYPGARRRSRPPPAAIAASRWSSGNTASPRAARSVQPRLAAASSLSSGSSPNRVASCARSRATASSSISRCIASMRDPFRVGCPGPAGLQAVYAR